MSGTVVLVIKRAPRTDVEFIGDVRSACIFLEQFLREPMPPNDVIVGGTDAAKNHITLYVRDVVNEIIADLHVKRAHAILNGVQPQCPN